MCTIVSAGVVILSTVQLFPFDFYISPGTVEFLGFSEFPTRHPLFITLSFDFVLCGLILCFVNLYLMYLLLRGSCCGCYFPHLSCLYCYTTVRLIIKALLTTILGVVSLLQETEPLFLWKMLFPINDVNRHLL